MFHQVERKQTCVQQPFIKQNKIMELGVVLETTTEGRRGGAVNLSHHLSPRIPKLTALMRLWEAHKSTYMTMISFMND
jgi:hypothetical protein